MLKTIGSCTLLACLALTYGAQPAYAQRQAPVFGGGASSKHTINFLVGGFFPKTGDGRTEGDVLVANSTFLSTDVDDFDNFTFDTGKFKSFTFGAEWLIPIGNYVEAGAGATFSKKTVGSFYTDYTDSDGTDVDQDLSLRMIPLAFTARVLPFGQSSPVQPYVGGGIGLIFWNYSETGEFIDFGLNPPQVFEDDETYKDSGTSVGPLFLAGLRYAAESFTVGGEFRYQWAEGDLEPLFAGPKIDLGGWTLNGTIGFKF